MKAILLASALAAVPAVAQAQLKRDWDIANARYGGNWVGILPPKEYDRPIQCPT